MFKEADHNTDSDDIEGSLNSQNFKAKTKSLSLYFYWF